MLKSLLRDRLLLSLLVLALLIKIFSLSPSRVERYYTYGFYLPFSKTLRYLFGWIPFSVGDLLYAGAFCWLVLKAWKLIRLLAKRQVKEFLSWILFRKYLRLVLWIYIVFNIFWGLNYDRQGIASQLGLDVRTYSVQDLVRLTAILQQRLNFYAARVDTVKRQELDRNPVLFREGRKNYELARGQYPFLNYWPPSIKPSLFSVVGHYFGFSGYFNPFTSEAQLNTREPVFTKPFIIDHELAHQLGYGKENEANFVSYLACKRSDNIDFRYSVYYELYFGALYECRMVMDTASFSRLKKNIDPRVRRDKLEEIRFRLRKKNGMQPYVSEFYNNYLKLNNQPRGLATYDEVTAWLIGYMKRYGEEAL
jgi:hypothetical protein